MVDKYQCRECGHVAYIMRPGPEPVTFGDWQPVERHEFATGATMPVMFQEYERRVPIRSASVGSDVAVPLLSAIVTAIATMILCAVAAYAWHLPAWLVFLAGAIAFAVSWFLLSSWYRQTLLQAEYRRTEPPSRPDPVPEPVVKRVRLQVDDGRRRQYADLPLDLAELQATARAIQAGRPFSVGAMTGRGAPLSRSQYETLRSWLMTGGYLVWIDEANRQAGTIFTKRGDALIRALAEG